MTIIHDTRKPKSQLSFSTNPANMWGPDEHGDHHIGWFKWGVYIFYDYDGEPIYIGQTNEKISGRISRHLTNQRTDAVAMNVLAPFEVFEIEAYPLPDFQHITRRHAEFKSAKDHLDALEYYVHQHYCSQHFQSNSQREGPRSTEGEDHSPKAFARTYRL
jgi:hypothetical protein